MKKFRIIALLLILSLLLLPGSAFAGEREGVRNTALGDSVAYGVGASKMSSYESSYAVPLGMNGYTDMFNKHMTEMYGVGIYANVSLPGLTSAQLKDSLVTPTNAFDFAINTAVTDADILTVSIGGNDIMQPIIAFIETYPQYLAPGTLEEILAMPMATWPTELQLLVVELGVNSVQFGSNWMAMMSDLRMARGLTADVYVNNLYNPFLGDEVLYAFAEPFISSINAIIENPITIGMYGYQVVDVKGAFDKIGDKNKALVHDMTDLSVALHPTDRGYKTICRLHKKLLQ